MNTKYVLALALSAALVAPSSGIAAECNAKSAEHRVPLLELYTSEGCNSCPPADRWLSALPKRGLSTQQVVALGFHVDYWNYLGWRDPFSSSEYSDRQRSASIRNRARFVYTPQLLFDGKDYRRGFFRDDIVDRVNATSRERPGAKIELAQNVEGADAILVRSLVTTTASSAGKETRAYVALYENQLANRVAAGENGGKFLEHDFVVRELSPPHAATSGEELDFRHRFTIDRTWKRENLFIAAFVQNERSGSTLQALAVPICR